MANQQQEQSRVVRLAGKSYTLPQDEEALNAAAENLGVDVTRAFGVASTEERPNRIKSGPRARARALALEQEQSEAASDAEGEDTSSLGETSVAELADALQGFSDVGALRKAMRRDKRVSARPHYERRIAELQEQSQQGEGAE